MIDTFVLLAVHCLHCMGTISHMLADTPAGVALTCTGCGLRSEILMAEEADAPQEN